MPPNQPPRLKYSKKLSAIGAASAAAAAVLTLGTASAAFTTINANVEMDANVTWRFAFVPNGSSYVSTYPSTPEDYPAVVQHCGLYLFGVTSDLQWIGSLLAAGETVDASDTFIQETYLSAPGDGQTVYAGYRYTVVDLLGGREDYYYGYITVTDGENNRYTVDSYNYQSTPNTGITIPAVPEPSAALLAAAGAGLVLRRRRMR